MLLGRKFTCIKCNVVIFGEAAYQRHTKVPGLCRGRGAVFKATHAKAPKQPLSKNRR